MKNYFGSYWIIQFILVAVLIYMARYWYKVAIECQDANPDQVGITYPIGRFARALVN